MSKLYVCALVGLATMVFAANVGAGEAKPGHQPGTHNPGKSINWAEMQARCANPEQFDVQRAPQNVRIQCMESRVTWMAAAPGEVFLPGSRRVTSGVFADKFFVDAQTRELPVYSKSGSCHRFKEVEEMVTIERAVSCAEILAIKGELGDFCASMTEAAKGANPKLVDIRETGRMIDTCGGGGVQNGQGKPMPPR